ncbi:hypothetical protein SBOR_5156 [Sclerotinia borealis F-4128]|uniref:Uncharacterized protein n=1 Tax=Sclerotinia borealis (strain F-4128) TaxID=1432307 RepID=W9CEX1_SCLBF|nr:hypothetical protein SBOR_5156 [Sclerotinia borealis F-4128]
MPSRHQKSVCQGNSQPFYSALLLLSMTFPKVSHAQILPAVLTTFITSATPPSNTLLALNTRQLDSTQSAEDTSSHVYNYYFVIVAVFVVLIFFILLYFTRRRKRKAELLRNNGRTALARDVQTFADFRTRFGPRRGGSRVMGMTMGSTGVHRETPEGLDERGEAPPAYVEGGKPPSLRSDDGIAMMISNEDHDNANGAPSAPVVATAGNNSSTTEHDASGLGSRLSAELSRSTITTARNMEGRTSLGDLSTPVAGVVESNQGVELRPLSRSASTRPPLGPPTYSETYLGEEPDLTRPAAAVTAHDRFASTRRFMSDSRTSSET